jgi:hypothetical protein
MKPFVWGSGEFASVDEVQSAMLRLLLDQGDSVSPRGIPTVAFSIDSAVGVCPSRLENCAGISPDQDKRLS